MELQAAKFDYNFESKLYTAEISELELHAVPREFTINGFSFVFTHTDKDASGEDIAGWHFRPTMGAVQQHPGLAGHRVLIIND